MWARIKLLPKPNSISLSVRVWARILSLPRRKLKWIRRIRLVRHAKVPSGESTEIFLWFYSVSRYNTSPHKGDTFRPKSDLKMLPEQQILMFRPSRHTLKEVIFKVKITRKSMKLFSDLYVSYWGRYELWKLPNYVGLVPPLCSTVRRVATNSNPRVLNRYAAYLLESHRHIRTCTKSSRRMKFGSDRNIHLSPNTRIFNSLLVSRLLGYYDGKTTEPSTSVERKEIEIASNGFVSTVVTKYARHCCQIVLEIRLLPCLNLCKITTWYLRTWQPRRAAITSSFVTRDFFSTLPVVN